MPVTSRDLWDLASKLGPACELECERRSVIGRAYYAVFHCASEFHDSLPAPGIFPQNGGVHAQLSHALANPTVGDVGLRQMSKRLGYICRDLHAKRVVADYHLDAEVSKTDLDYVLSMAESVFSDFSPA